jgi:hypothetical protein
MIFLPSKSDMDRNIQSVAGECESRMLRWKAFAEKIDGITDPELTGLGYTSGQIGYIRSFSVALKNVELRYRNQAPLNSDDPSYFIKQMSAMLVF